MEILSAVSEWTASGEIFQRSFSLVGEISRPPFRSFFPHRFNFITRGITFPFQQEMSDYVFVVLIIEIK